MSAASDDGRGGLRRPSVGTEDASRIARDHYGIEAIARELGSNQDRNFLLEELDGQRSVLRVDNPAFDDDARDAQHAALTAYQDAGIRVPAVLPGLDGELTQRCALGYAVRRSEFVVGRPLIEVGYLAPAVLEEFGALAAASVDALAVLTHPGLDRTHMWIMGRAHDEILRLAPSIAVDDLRRRVVAAADEAQAALLTVEGELSSQAIHGDLTDDNVLGLMGDDARLHPHTLIDLGDVAYGWRVSEISVSASSLLHHDPERPLRVLDAVAAFHRRVPLSDAEARAVWPLIVLRGAILVASGWRQLELDGTNEYAQERVAVEQTIFDAATAIPLSEAVEHVRARLLPNDDRDAEIGADTPETRVRSLLPELAGPVVLIDPGVEGPAQDAGRWLHDDAEERLVADALSAGATAAVLPYGVYRLTRTVINSTYAAETWPVATELWIAAGGEQTVVAPVSGTITQASEHGVVIDRGDGWSLGISGVRADRVVGETVGVGARMGTVPAATEARSLTIILCRSDVRDPIARMWASGAGRSPLVSPDRVPGWARLTRDPASLIGIQARAQADLAIAELERREQVFASAQERYFERPMQVQRGWQHHLVDTTGRAYVDVVNNVMGLGHGHEGVARAVGEQIRALATNSRFLYRQLAEYSERLLALLPADSNLDTVILVNSGSEAVDLAIRLAQAATGRQTIVTVREAYHGWTMASDAVTTSAYDNPSALASRPDWVHVADVPNRFRGTYRGPSHDSSVGERYAADIGDDLDRLATGGREAAAFICEPILGNAGGVLLPRGYLAEVYRRVRATGGLCIADEVQVGFGRMGSSFWGFEESGVVPDIITIAKPMGNGFPIGGVITTRAVADALATQGQFFSTTGGNPLSCRVGLAVLDAMEAEQLQHNAWHVGRRLAAGLQSLARQHDIVGPVHGSGLYLGVELVRDRETMEPARPEAVAICERLRELGVVVQTTSERSNVLKIKPPLCFTAESADFVVASLDRVLTEGW